MDQQGQTSGGPSPSMGPAGRRLHIAHRRSPSELTPLMSTLSLSDNAIVYYIRMYTDHR